MLFSDAWAGICSQVRQHSAGVRVFLAGMVGSMAEDGVGAATMWWAVMGGGCVSDWVDVCLLETCYSSALVSRCVAPDMIFLLG